MATNLTLKLGQTVQTNDGREGIIQFIGKGSFAAGEWIGLELPNDAGKNDGSVSGERYFQCQPGHGLFLRRTTIKKIIKQPTSSTSKRMSAMAKTRSRQMSVGSTGSRQSQKPPSKTPSTTTRSSTSSSSSTPRTATPPVPVEEGPASTIAAQSENESLKAKLRAMEKKRLEDRERLKEMESLREDNERYQKNIIPALQEKLRSSKQELSSLCVRNQELETKASSDDTSIAANVAELEIATIDKEIAEQHAETLAVELDEVKQKNEVLELEVEILREESSELVSNMSPEERASAGWLQLERERNLLRDALVELRDRVQHKESDHKSQINELQASVAHAEKFKTQYEHVSEKLIKSEATNKHLLEQVEAAEANEEVVLQLEAQRTADAAKITQMTESIKQKEEEAHNDVEEKWQLMLDRSKSDEKLEKTRILLYESELRVEEQDQTVQDLEYALIKCGNVVHTLKHDIDKLNNTRDAEDTSTEELNRKDRDLSDLRLTLATQTVDRVKRDIDHRMSDNALVEAKEKVEILEKFVVSGYEEDMKTPIAFMHKTRKIKEKATLVVNYLRANSKNGPYRDEDPMLAFEVIEKLGGITVVCERLDTFMVSCDVAVFSRMSASSGDLEPVERAVDRWLYAVQENDMGKGESDSLQRMLGVVEDLAEKFIVESCASHNTEIIAAVSMTENYLYSAIGQLQTLDFNTQCATGKGLPEPLSDDYLQFQSKIEELAIKARTTRFVTEKLVRGLREMQQQSIGLSEQTWGGFAGLESAAKHLSQLIGTIIRALNKTTEDVGQAGYWPKMTWDTFVEVITKATRTFLQLPPTAGGEHVDYVFSVLASKVQQLHEKVINAQLKARDLSSIVDIERRPCPWLVRAEEIKADKNISADVQEELRRLTTRIQEQVIAISTKDRQLEDLQAKVELVQARADGTKERSLELRQANKELVVARAERKVHEKNAEQARGDFEALKAQHERLSQELETPKKLGSVASGAARGRHDDTGVFELRAEQAHLRSRVEETQASVRQIKFEAYWAGLSVSEDEAHGWDGGRWIPFRLQNVLNKKVPVKEETDTMFKELLSLASSVKMAMIQPQLGGWRSARSTPRHAVLQQKGQVAQWEGKREEVAKKARMAGRGGRAPWRR